MKLMQNQKYWAKPDEIALADKSDGPPPPDPFKQTFYKKEKKDESFLKINEINLFKNEPLDDDTSTVVKRQFSRFTETVNQFRSYKKIRTEKTKKQQEIDTSARKDKEPLYSSFTADKVFVDPLSKSKTKTKTVQNQNAIQNDRSKSTERKSIKPSERKSIRPSDRKSTKPTGAYYKKGKDNLIARISMKKTIGEKPELDIKRTVIS